MAASRSKDKWIAAVGISQSDGDEEKRWEVGEEFDGEVSDHLIDNGYVVAADNWVDPDTDADAEPPVDSDKPTSRSSASQTQQKSDRQNKSEESA